MTTRVRLVSTRRALLVAGLIAALASGLAAVGGFAQTNSGDAAFGRIAAGAAIAPGPASTPDAGIGPDVVVFSFDNGVFSWGASGGYVAYSIGTTSCNRGDTPLNWCASSSSCAAGTGPEDHPVIGQNLYRLKDQPGRGVVFEQIGMSWLKHGFTSLNQNTTGCRESSSTGSCQSPPFGGRQLGIVAPIPTARA